MKKLLIFLLTISSVHAQELTVGVKGDFSLTDMGKSNSTSIFSRVILQDLESSPKQTVGVFARVDKRKHIFQGELNHTWGDMSNYASSSFGGGGYSRDLTFISPRITYSYKLFPWFRMNLGVGTNFLYESKFSKKQRIEEENRVFANLDSQFKQYENDNSEQGRYVREFIISQRNTFSVINAFNKSPNKVNFDARVGVGVDVGGFMIDLNYNRSLTPIVSNLEFNGQTNPIRLNSNYLSLSVGYRILPIRKFILAPKKNKTYEKIQSEIPFYKNEVNFLFGKQMEDANSLNTYESSYTRYLLKRVGITLGVNTIQSPLYTTNVQNLPNIGIQNSIAVFSELKILPLYNKKHRIGISAGINFMKYEGIEGNTGLSTLQDGSIIYPVYLQYSVVPKKSSLGYQATADYNYLLTKRIAIGAWLRTNVNYKTSYGTYASLGIKTGYLF